mmetsp:Transcript_56954/g.152098  ORF Transcript_56954/g.152098 Transcript_56954/m.152098 type:complete len:204 (-) Transcript_56954:13-624(-)
MWPRLQSTAVPPNEKRKIPPSCFSMTGAFFAWVCTAAAAFSQAIASVFIAAWIWLLDHFAAVSRASRWLSFPTSGPVGITGSFPVDTKRRLHNHPSRCRYHDRDEKALPTVSPKVLDSSFIARSRAASVQGTATFSADNIGSSLPNLGPLSNARAPLEAPSLGLFTGAFKPEASWAISRAEVLRGLPPLPLPSLDNLFLGMTS